MEHEIRVYVWEKPTNVAKCDELVGLFRRNYDENREEKSQVQICV